MPNTCQTCGFWIGARCIMWNDHHYEYLHTNDLLPCAKWDDNPPEDVNLRLVRAYARIAELEAELERARKSAKEAAETAEEE